MAISQVADLHIHDPSQTECLSNGNSKGALPHAQQWVIDVNVSPETSLLDQRDTELHLHLSLTVTIQN